jgi:Na+/proline symporter
MASDNVAIYTIMPIYLFLMVCISGFSFLKNSVSGTIMKLGGIKVSGQKVENEAQSFLGAGNGLSGFVLFFTMAASLFSGYSVSGIANEAYTFGFLAIRWVPAGVALYGAFMFLAPRLHALGKARGYLTIGEFMFDRYAEPAFSPLIPHSLRLLTLFCQMLPVFCYLITQFTAIGIEVICPASAQFLPFRS